MTTKAQLAQYCADHPHIIKTGITYVHALISGLVSFVLGGGLGYYIRGRGLRGVAIDAGNAEAKIASVL